MEGQKVPVPLCVETATPVPLSFVFEKLKEFGEDVAAYSG